MTAVQFGMLRLKLLSRISCNAWLLLIGVPVAIFWTDFFPTAQMRNIEAARKHAMVIKQLIQTDPRFSSIIVDVWTGGGVEMTAQGELASEADMNALIKIIETTTPPASMMCWFQIAGKERQLRLPKANHSLPKQ